MIRRSKDIIKLMTNHNICDILLIVKSLQNKGNNQQSLGEKVIKKWQKAIFYFSIKPFKIRENRWSWKSMKPI